MFEQPEWRRGVGERRGIERPERRGIERHFRVVATER
jgi:hypothetical protein